MLSVRIRVGGERVVDFCVGLEPSDTQAVVEGLSEGEADRKGCVA